LTLSILAGLAGRNILSSRSPWLHEQEASAQGLKLRYELFDFADRSWGVDRLPALLADSEQAGFAGLNITYPFKQVVIPLLDEMSEGARIVGAVNTVAFRNGKRIGHNTDVTGFAESFRVGLPGASLDRVVQIGAGGAGAATAQALMTLGVQHLSIFDADRARQSLLVQRLRDVVGPRVVEGVDRDQAVRAADGIVNATPVGMANLPGTPIDTGYLEARHWVADIVYFPLETALLVQARQRGCRTLNGGGMAVGQAATAFEIFTGLSADRSRMEASFDQFVVNGRIVD
jgi:shikimate dehydrogenase